MQTEIYSFEEIEKRAKALWQSHTALISIGDPGLDKPQLTYKPEYILRLEFDDIMPDEEGEGIMFTNNICPIRTAFFTRNNRTLDGHTIKIGYEYQIIV